MSSLSSVVSNLVRAQLGSSVSSTVTDDDLDRHVAELILKEAKKKAEKYSQHGIRAYLRNNIVDSNAPKTNKRFLTSIIRSTDDHNKTVLRAQALAAEEVKQARLDAERKERRARAEEAVAAEKMRRSRGEGSSSSSSRRRSRHRREDKDKRKGEDESWDRWDGRRAERKRISRDWETWDGNESDRSDAQDRKRRRTSRTRDRKRHKDSRKRSKYEDEHKRHRSRSHSLDTAKRTFRRDDSPAGASDTSSRGRTRGHKHDDARSPRIHVRGSDSCSRQPSPLPSDREAELRRALKGKQKATSPPIGSRKRSSSETTMSISEPASRASTPGPAPLPQLPSKMDKYFEESYDPRLDVAPLSAPKVPATGLINNAEYEGWDAMLDLLRQRKEDKDERKRMERLGIPIPKATKPNNQKSLGGSSAMDERWSVGDNIMGIEYKKRGSVREWDVGKQGF
ncbi:hypothetical protein CCMSSC00406_0006519 [Pleurotus cornucopiae]|uniref:Uncharacterized protein n=1 Tax=Pleurotus cornucopiae TaxID=5321 RepID=A0ACB7IVD6_PLECO|nr:hypothetical protein CCMSSC00406_0006519 [Pleurotus cornucopiae]